MELRPAGERWVLSALGRAVVALVLASGSLVGASGQAGAAADGSTASEASPASLPAERILASAPPGESLTVVITSGTVARPTISTVEAPSRAAALRVITDALAQPSTIGVDMAQPVRATATNDTFRPRQWALDLYGAERRWPTSTGSGVVVAVVDTGVSGVHPDLSGVVLAGADFVDPGTLSTDENGHGSHVAGVIAAKPKNRRGVAGLAPGARILPVRVLDARGRGDSATVAKGIIWAVDKGAHVINLSLATPTQDTALRTAVAHARSRNRLVVAAVGNNGCTPAASVQYPAGYPGVVGVGAVSSSLAVAPYSACAGVDVVAAGTSVISTVLPQGSRNLACYAGNPYCFLDGTSMAAPYVSAIAALEMSRIKRSGRTWTEHGIAAKLERTANDLGARGRDERYGAGLANAARMLTW